MWIGKSYFQTTVRILFKQLFKSSANATPEFQGRGGEAIASQIVNILNNIFSTKNFDLTQLCIAESKKCWHLYIDIVVSFVVYIFWKGFDLNKIN